MKKQFNLYRRPNGCEIEAEVENGQVISVTGHTCPRGRTVCPSGADCAPPHHRQLGAGQGRRAACHQRPPDPGIPKDMIFPVMDEIRKVVLTAPSRQAPSFCTTSADWTVT